MLHCRMLPPGLVQYSLQYSSAIAVKLFLHTLGQLPCDESIQQYWHDRIFEKMRFILSERFDFHMIDNLSKALHAFASCVLMSFSVDERLLHVLVNLSTSLRDLPFNVEMSYLWLKDMNSILSSRTWRPMPSATRFWQYNGDSARAVVFARSAMSTFVIVRAGIFCFFSEAKLTHFLSLNLLTFEGRRLDR